MNSFLKTTLALLLATTWTFGQHPTTENVRLTTPDLTLDGTLTVPATTTKKIPVILLIAGSGATDRDGNSKGAISCDAYRILADSLNARGIAVLRYDKRAVGKSLPADLANFKEDNMRFEQGINDAVGWVRQLQADKRFSKVIVAGHSEGSLVGMVAARQANANGYISLAGTGRNIADVLKVQLKTLPDELRELSYRDLDSLRNGQLVRKPPFMLMSLFRPSVQPYMISWMKYDPAAEIKQYTGPVLLIQGKRDLQVAVSEAEALKAARPDAPLLLFDNMTHVLKDADGDDQAANLKTYKSPEIPLTPGLAKAIAEFAKK